MLRKKSLFAVLLLAAMTLAIPAAAQNPTPPAVCDPTTGTYATLNQNNVQAAIAGSSAMFQSVGLGAYNAGAGVSGVAVAPTFHYVSNSKFTLADYRPTAGTLGGSVVNSDTGTVWIVWDSQVTGGKCNPHVWIYLVTDSVVGNRAFFGSIGVGGTNVGVYIQAPASWPADDGGSQINSHLWVCTDTAVGCAAAGQQTPGVVPHTAIQGLFSNGTTKQSQLISVGATDIRPEDAYFAINRVNSSLDSTNGYQGLGYNSSNPAGTSPGLSTNCSGGAATTANLVGTGIKGDYNNDGPFNVLSFNIQGQDPFTCNSIGSPVTIPVGATPIVFIHSNFDASGLKGLQNATTAELEKVFSGGNNGTAGQNGGQFSNCASCTDNIGVILREPLSGTYNTTEETTMRHPSAIATYRFSQETGVNGATNNPLGGFDGFRWRGIGTGDEVKSVRDFFGGATGYPAKSKDAIGYTFYSYGNVSPIADNSNYSYVTLNGVDPIWHNYVAGTLGITDPGQPATAGTLPGNADLPASCGTAGTFPCNESHLWAADNFSIVNGAVNPVTGNPYPSYSFPNLRNGTYSAWSIVRLITTSSRQTAVQNLVNTSNTYVVTTTPDYVPFDQVPAGMTGASVIDPGMQFLRSHFGCLAATCGTNSFTGNPSAPTNTPELGRDAGGAILVKADATTGFTQDGPEDTWVIAFE